MDICDYVYICLFIFPILVSGMSSTIIICSGLFM